MSSQSDIENIDKESDEIYRIDMVNNKKYDERHNIVERQANEIDLEESETYEIG